MTSINWQRWLQLAALKFSLKPAEFWQLSICEWRALVSGDLASSLDSSELAQLMTHFPDG